MLPPCFHCVLLLFHCVCVCVLFSIVCFSICGSSITASLVFTGMASPSQQGRLPFRRLITTQRGQELEVSPSLMLSSPFACDLCKKSFLTSQALHGHYQAKEHQRLHDQRRDRLCKSSLAKSFDRVAEDATHARTARTERTHFKIL